jgi:hypothetical protein
MRQGENLPAQPSKEAGASNAAGRASASTTAKETGASNAAGRASASTTAEEASASNAAGRAPASTTAKEEAARIVGRMWTSACELDRRAMTLF